MSSEDLKKEAHRLIENLPDDATWDDLMYEIYVRKAIEAGLADSEAGRTLDVNEVRARFATSPITRPESAPTKKPREGWEEAFREMAERGDDRLLDDGQIARTSWGEREWPW